MKEDAVGDEWEAIPTQPYQTLPQELKKTGELPAIDLAILRCSCFGEEKDDPRK